ncbi:uncharacterized protein LOC103517790 isoform X2 [Diaphorina citri]|uniref:Uncharacterized protein LOC103517790 isoform X2 n=1 Tax=Diaphorina citri TaxID=121845 RepID=A0A1S3DG41_DIACI|nr:uncharacterized protein LOC103517790 isoform X2 [Diaphorina citri]
MQPFNKDILKEYLNNELKKGLKIKFAYDPIHTVTLPVRDKKCFSRSTNNMSDNKQSCQFDVETYSDKGEETDSSSCEMTRSKEDRLEECYNFMRLNPQPRSVISCFKFFETSQDLERDNECLGTSNYSTCVSNSIKCRQRDSLKKRIKECYAGICTFSGQGDVNVKSDRRSSRRKKSDIYILGNNREILKNTKETEQHKSKSEKCKRTKTTVQTQHQCNFHVKQKNLFHQTNDPCKYRSTLKQMIRLPNNLGNKDNVIGPIPIKAEGINELTKRIEQLVQDAGNGVVQRKLKLCKQNESSDNCLEFDVAIRKISFEEITVRTKEKRPCSIFSPFFCFSARSESDDGLKECKSLGQLKPKVTPSKSKHASESKNKTSWRMNIPFLEKFRLNPKCCNVKVLDFGAIPVLEASKETALADENANIPRVCRPSPIRRNKSSCTGSSETLQLTLKKYKPYCDESSIVHYVHAKSKEMHCHDRSQGRTKRVKKFLGFPEERQNVCNFSLPLKSEDTVMRTNSTDTTFNSHHAPKETVSPVVCRQIYLTPTVCMENKSQQQAILSNRLPKGFVKPQKEILPRKRVGQQTIPASSNQNKNVSLKLLTSSFRKLFKTHLQATFQAAFETKNIEFINPFELDRRIQKKFKLAHKCLKKGSFVVKKIDYSKYFYSSLCHAKISSLENVCIKSYVCPTVDLTVHLDDYHMKDILQQLQSEATNNEPRVSLCERELKSVFFNEVKSATITKQVKGVAGSQKQINSYTVNVHPPNFRRIGTFIPKWTPCISKGAGDKIKHTVTLASTIDTGSKHGTNELAGVSIQKVFVEKMSSHKSKPDYVAKELKHRRKEILRKLDNTKAINTNDKNVVTNKPNGDAPNVIFKKSDK